MESKLFKIFNEGSRTFSSSSIFFPKDIRKDVAILYSFVRELDNYIDINPQNIKGYEKFKADYFNVLAGHDTQNKTISLFVDLSKRKNFDEKWIEKFFESMEMDTHKNEYKNLEDLIKYMHGSAEVIGLFMAKILDLPEQSYPYAQMLGRTFQYINFIRDINNDMKLGRTYMPKDELEKFELRNLTLEFIMSHKNNYYNFINLQIERYIEWQNVAAKGFKYIPKKYLIPIKTASDMFIWTAKQIKRNPLLIYQKTVRPSKHRIILQGILNIFVS
jgi:15-cis-phytoene synthase